MSPDAVVVGAGPNGLAAAITIARAGRSVLLLEAAQTVGGGLRSAELTLPGFVHDVCSSAHPLGVASPFFRSVDLARHGLEWVHPELPFAHGLTPDRMVPLHRSFDEMDAVLGRDGRAWRRLLEPLAREHERLLPMLLRPVVRFPRHPLLLARFGLPALLPTTGLGRLAFRGPEAPALLAGTGGHAAVPFSSPLSASFGIVLVMLAHAVGWPVARGGSQRIADAMAAEARALGVEIVTGNRVTTLRDVPPARAIVFDVTPRQLLAITGDRLAARYAEQLRRFRYAPGVVKVDWALSGPIPWRDPVARLAGTIHLGGSVNDMRRAEAAAFAGRVADHPYVVLIQPTIADPSRAPTGGHVAWAYTHVPNGSSLDLSAALEREVERFAPGFRDAILARHVATAPELEAHDANFVGGDINGGMQDWRQLVFRPFVRWNPYSVAGDTRLFLGSASTPPGGGVHGMSGWHAAQSALRRLS